MRRYTFEIVKLQNTHAQGNKHLGVQLREGTGQVRLQKTIQLRLMAKDPENHLVGQPCILAAKALPSMPQEVRRIAALMNCPQDIKGNIAGWRDAGQPSG